VVPVLGVACAPASRFKHVSLGGLCQVTGCCHRSQGAAGVAPGSPELLPSACPRAIPSQSHGLPLHVPLSQFACLQSRVWQEGSLIEPDLVGGSCAAHHHTLTTHLPITLLHLRTTRTPSCWPYGMRMACTPVALTARALSAVPIQPVCQLASCWPLTVCVRRFVCPQARRVPHALAFIKVLRRPHESGR
jgi:hypothetical protein